MTKVLSAFLNMMLLLSFSLISAYSQSITNIQAYPEDQKIVVKYDIDGAVTGTTYNIELFVSMDGGRIFNGPLKKVTGDVGPDIRNFKNNQIVWNVLAEYPSFVSDKVMFELHGTPNNKIEIQFESITGGYFNMGSRDGDEDARPSHKVTIGDFSIGKYEVTQEQWFKIMGYNPSVHVNCPDCPVDNVTYNEVIKFIEKLNKQTSGYYYRLPTEAEWEYVANMKTANASFLYSGGNSIDAVAWYVANSAGSTHSVGKKSPNNLGIFDMSGNVAEWCLDYYSPLYYRSSTGINPQGPASGRSRVIRGGSWNQAASLCRVYSRSYEDPGYKSSNIGFRLVKIKN
jgi:formylglycine-generating enzyme required for sulfatase activity